MNVLVSNVKSNELSNLDIDIIKSVTGQYDANELVSMFKDFFFEKMIIDVTSIKNYEDIQNIQKLAIELGESKLILVLPDSLCNSGTFLSGIISMGIYNFTNNINAIKQLIIKPNAYKDVAQIQQLCSVSIGTVGEDGKKGIRVLGIKNVTEHAGATSLIYMIKKELSKMFGNSIYCIEINKNDFMYFNDKNMSSINDREITSKLSELANAKFILVDLNGCKDEAFCDEILYLIEPSPIKLNKLIRKDREIFGRLKSKKLVLNKSLLNNKEIEEFEYEASSKVFYNLPPLDERKDNSVLMDLLSKLGLVNDTASKKEDGNRIFGLFRH